MTKQIKLAERWLNEGAIEEEEMSNLISSLNSDTHKYSVVPGFLCAWGTPADLDVRRNEMKTRYKVFETKEEAELKASEICGNGDRNGKFKFFRYMNNGEVVLVISYQDYKGDYGQTQYIYDVDEICEYLIEAAKKALSGNVSGEYKKYFVLAGEIYGSKEDASKTEGFYLGDCVVISGMDAAQKEAENQQKRILMGTWGD